MPIVRETKTLIFNNNFCKPMPIADSAPCTTSMVVCYIVDGLVYYGQYNSETNFWSVLDGQNSKLKFSDDVVTEWWYTSDSIKLLKEEETKKNKNKYHIVTLNNVI